LPPIEASSAHPKLKEHPASAIALIKSSRGWEQFHTMLDGRYPAIMKSQADRCS